MSAIRRHRRVLLLLAQGDGDETVTPHKDARGGPPAQACGGSEDTLGWPRNDGVGRDVGGRCVCGWLEGERHLVQGQAWGPQQRGLGEEDRGHHGWWRKGRMQGGGLGHSGWIQGGVDYERMRITS